MNNSLQNKTLVKSLRRTYLWRSGAVAELLGPDAHPVICFDRGGWSPATFAELVKMGFDILTYRKAPLAREPRSAFRSDEVTDTFGHS